MAQQNFVLLFYIAYLSTNVFPDKLRVRLNVHMFKVRKKYNKNETTLVLLRIQSQTKLECTKRCLVAKVTDKSARCLSVTAVHMAPATAYATLNPLFTTDTVTKFFITVYALSFTIRAFFPFPILVHFRLLVSFCWTFTHTASLHFHHSSFSDFSSLGSLSWRERMTFSITWFSASWLVQPTC